MASKKVNITMPELPQIELHLFGNWQKVTSLISGMGPSIQRGYDKGVRRCSRAILIIVRRAVNTGLPPKGTYWQPLSQATIRTHGKHGIYRLKGLYARSIGMFQYKGRTLVGIQANIKVPDTNITLNQLAIILEHGSKVNPDGGGNGIPKRPLWSASFKAYGGIDKLKKEILRDIRRSLIKEHGLNSSQIR